MKPATTWGLVALIAALSPACTKSLPSAARGEQVAVGAATLATAVWTAPSASAAPEPKNAAAPKACPEGMTLVDGEYCPEVEEKCLEWMDPPGNRYHEFRCAHYAPSVCKSKERVHMRYCI